MNIKKGIIVRPQKVVIYGPEGIGKSTFASHFPAPLFLDVEGSTAQLDVDRIDDITSWSLLMETVKGFNKDRGGYETLIVDTSDWAERLCIQHICARDRKASIEDYGYGSGYVKLLEEFNRFLELLNDTIKAGANVVLTAHAQIRKFEQPDEMGAYDRWELKLNKKTTAQTAMIVKEWADAVLFANYKTIVVTDKEKKKAIGGERVMYTQHRPTWDAKNRWGLPAEMPFDFSGIAKFIPAGNAAAKTQQEEKTTATPQQKKENTAPEQKEEKLTPQEEETVLAGLEKEQPNIRSVKKVFDLMEQSGITEKQVIKAVAMRGYFPESIPSISSYPKDFIDGVLIGAWGQLAAYIKEHVSAPF